MDTNPHDHLQFRPGTMDRAVFDAVFTHNEYRLPERFSPDDLLMDVGGHIGSFSFTALTRGAGRVYTFEAEEGNAAAVRHNLAPFGERSVVRRAAVYRNDQDVKTLSFNRSHDPSNTAGGVVGPQPTSQTVPVAKFDALVDEATDHGRRRVRLLKLDCEGSEWGILFTTRKLHLIDAICGEYHDVTDFGPAFEVGRRRNFTPDDLIDILVRHGFNVEIDPARPPCGLFFARRPGALEFVPAPSPMEAHAARPATFWDWCRTLWPFGERNRAAA